MSGYTPLILSLLRLSSHTALKPSRSSAGVDPTVFASSRLTKRNNLYHSLCGMKIKLTSVLVQEVSFLIALQVVLLNSGFSLSLPFQNNTKLCIGTNQPKGSCGQTPATKKLLVRSVLPTPIEKNLVRSLCLDLSIFLFFYLSISCMHSLSIYLFQSHSFLLPLILFLWVPFSLFFRRFLSFYFVQVSYFLCSLIKTLKEEYPPKKSTPHSNYGVATISRIFKPVGLFCKRVL